MSPRSSRHCCQTFLPGMCMTLRVDRSPACGVMTTPSFSRRSLSSIRCSRSCGSPRHREWSSELDDVADGPRILREARPPSPVPITRKPTKRPLISLRESALLVNGHRDYQIGSEVARELESADKVDMLSAFVRFAGLRLVRDQLAAFVDRGGQLRVITSVYTGSTKRRHWTRSFRWVAKSRSHMKRRRLGFMRRRGCFIGTPVFIPPISVRRT